METQVLIVGPREPTSFSWERGYDAFGLSLQATDNAAAGALVSPPASSTSLLQWPRRAPALHPAPRRHGGTSSHTSCGALPQTSRLERLHNLRKTSGLQSHDSAAPPLRPLQDTHRCVRMLTARALPLAMQGLGRSTAQEGKNERERESTTVSDGGTLHASWGCANALAPHSPCYGSGRGHHLGNARAAGESGTAGEGSGCGGGRTGSNGVGSALGSHPATHPCHTRPSSAGMTTSRGSPHPCGICGHTRDSSEVESARYAYWSAGVAGYRSPPPAPSGRENADHGTRNRYFS